MMDLFNRFLHDITERFPERPLSPPEPTMQQEREDRELVARDEFDEMAKPAAEWIMDTNRAAEIIKAAVERDAWGGTRAPVFYQTEVVRVIDAAREAYVEARLKGRA